ncbi:hypothetical protein LTR22_027413 [Elasticomyces elasticus]|nr:hypothetical protein LTR22_027413 [Elasticomyces elasticus]
MKTPRFPLVCLLPDSSLSAPTTTDPKFLDTSTALEKFLSDLGNSDGQPPRLYMDLEGNNLSRNGTLSLVTIMLEREKKVYLVAVTTLWRDAFTTAGADGHTLKSVLESINIFKVFFDVRNDSDALFGHYEICIAGIKDLQLMELASRNFSKRNINGLAKCTKRDTERLSRTLFKAAPARKQVRSHYPSTPGHSVVRSLSDDGDELANMLTHVSLVETEKVVDEDSDDDFVHGWNSCEIINGEV